MTPAEHASGLAAPTAKLGRGATFSFGDGRGNVRVTFVAEGEA